MLEKGNCASRADQMLGDEPPTPPGTCTAGDKYLVLCTGPEVKQIKRESPSLGNRFSGFLHTGIVYSARFGWVGAVAPSPKQLLHVRTAGDKPVPVLPGHLLPPPGKPCSQEIKFLARRNKRFARSQLNGS